MAKDRSQNLSELLSAYLDGELDEATTAKVVAHLERDSSAGLLLRELRETRGLLQDLPREPAPADFAESVAAAVERQALLGEAGDESSAGSARRRFGPIRSAAAIILLVGAAGSWIYWQIDRVQIAQMPVEHSATRSGSLADGHRPPEDFADSLAAAAVTAGEAASTSGRAGMGESSPESELALDKLSTASSSGVGELDIKAWGATGSLSASARRSDSNTGGRAASGTPPQQAKSVEQFDRDGKDESESEDLVVMLETEWSAEGAGDAGFGSPEFGLSRRLRVRPTSLPIVANFVQQLDQGQSAETLTGFQFDGESNSLVLDFDNYQQREQFARGVEVLLVSNSFLNAADPVSRSRVADPEIQNVYLPGNAGVNHTESDTTQMLLLAPMEVLEELLDEYTDTTKYPIIAESVEFKMGDIRVAGVEDARMTMKAMAVPQLRQKMLAHDLPRAEFSRISTETPAAGRTVEEWKFYYDRIEEDGREVFGGQLGQAGQPPAPDFDKDAGAEEGLQFSSVNRNEQIVGGGAADTSATVKHIQDHAPPRSRELEGELRAGDAERDEVAKKKRRVRVPSRSQAPVDGPLDGEKEERIVFEPVSGSIDIAGADLGQRGKKSDRRGGGGKASGRSLRARNLTFILKMRVPAPVYEFEGPPAPPGLKSKPSNDDEPSRSK